MSRRTFSGSCRVVSLVLACAATSTGSAWAQLPEFNPRVVIPRAMPAIEVGGVPVLFARNAVKFLDQEHRAAETGKRLRQFAAHGTGIDDR